MITIDNTINCSEINIINNNNITNNNKTLYKSQY